MQFRDLFAVLLLIAAGISFIAYILGGRDLYSLKVCIAILCVVLLNASIGFVAGLHGRTGHFHAAETGAAQCARLT